MRLALATWAGLPGLTEDERRLLGPLAELGATAEPAVWSDPSIPWDRFDAVVVRSTWDYHRRYPEFLEWIDRVDRSSTLWNPAATLRWNTHKSYLDDLRRHGVPAVPTRLCSDLASAIAAVREERWETAVLKPAVSADGYRTYRVRADALAAGDRPWGAEPPEGEILVQPYLTEVERSGERSLVFFGGEYSHAFLRAPKLGGASGLVEGTAVAPSPVEIDVAQRTLASAPEPTAYARVDLVLDAGGHPRIMELELVEPALELRLRQNAARSFARVLVEAVGQRNVRTE